MSCEESKKKFTSAKIRDLKFGGELCGLLVGVAQAHKSPHHNVFHGQASIFMKLCH